MGHRRRVLQIFPVIVILFWFAQYVYIPYQTIYLASVGATGGMIGAVVGAYGISQMILRLPAGICADRSGRHRPFMITGTAAAGAASLFRVCWCDGYGFMAANLLSGFASATWISFMVFYTGSFHEKEKQKATSRIVMFNNLGMLLGFIVSTLCYHRMGMRKLCFLSILAGWAACVLTFFLREEKAEKGVVPVSRSLWICREKRLLMFSMIALIQQGIQLTAPMSFTNQILKGCGASDRIIGISSIIYMVSAVGFSALASSAVCERKGPPFWIPAVLAAIAVYCMSVPATGSILGILCLQILPGMATGILFSYATAEAMKGIPKEKGSTAMGFYQAAYAVGMTIFPVVTGSIVAEKGMQAGYRTLAGIALAGSIVAKVFYRSHRLYEKKGS